MICRGRTSYIVVGFLSLIIMLSGCTADTAGDDETPAATTIDTSTPAAGDEETPSATPAETTPPSGEPSSPPEEADIELAAQSAQSFGFDLFNGLAAIKPEENVVSSPYSAAVLLTMLLNGADGETREAIGEVLHLEDPFDDSINEQHQTLADYLMSADPDVELAIANSLWANEGTPFEDDYMSETEDTFDARIEEVDLGSQEAADEIDEWVSEQTRERIEEMAEDLGLPDPNTVLILLNAVYFLGDWTDPFNPELTTDGPFTLPEGGEVEVPFMTKDDDHLYTQQDGFQTVRLPYGEADRYGMDIFLPDEGSDVDTLREQLDAEVWTQSLDELSEQRVQVALPSFELEYDTESDMNDVLKELGMGIAYGGESDFTPMSPNNPFLDTVVQKTFIRVDEEGTEAAAVTGGAMEESAPPQFRADRPFIFTISDRETGTILFLGQVTDPSE